MALPVRLPPRSRPGAFAARAVGQIYKEDGHTFRSFAEGKRYGELKLMLKAGEIEWLKVHPRYELKVGAIVVCVFEADFEYIDRRSGKKVVEDVKGWTVKKALAVRGGRVTRIRQVNVDYKLAVLKMRLFQAIYGTEVTIIEKR